MTSVFVILFCLLVNVISLPLLLYVLANTSPLPLYDPPQLTSSSLPIFDPFIPLNFTFYFSNSLYFYA